jgi:hypothetical protein
MMLRADDLDRSRFELVFGDDFDGAGLAPDRWIAHYLPQWSSPDRTAARYDVGGGRLRLRIDSDQPPWCPELDGDLRVSSIQTAVFSGPAGSRVGTHPFHPDAVVRTPQEERRLFTPAGGLIEIRMRAPADPRLMVSLWMIGIGDEPTHSGEICVVEIFGRDVRPDGSGAAVGMGVHPFEDPDLTDDFERVELDIDVGEPHVYSVDWSAERVAWFVDDRPVRTVAQSPAYPLQLMLGIYELPADPPPGAADRHPGADPEVFEVDWVRGFRAR